MLLFFAVLQRDLKGAGFILPITRALLLKSHNKFFLLPRCSPVLGYDENGQNKFSSGSEGGQNKDAGPHAAKGGSIAYACMRLGEWLR